MTDREERDLAKRKQASNHAKVDRELRRHRELVRALRNAARVLQQQRRGAAT